MEILLCRDHRWPRGDHLPGDPPPQPAANRRATKADDPATVALVRSVELRKLLPTTVPLTGETGVAAFIDVETTGLIPRTDEVIEFAADLSVLQIGKRARYWGR